MSRGRTWTAAAALAAAAAALAAAALVAAGAAAPSTRRCGLPAAEDQPDAASAFMIHVVYATAADTPDRLGERAAAIASDLAAIDRWWRTQDATRTPRLDLVADACDSPLGNLDLTDVRLPGSAAFYGDPAAGFLRITSDLERRLPTVAEKKYLVYYDGPLQLPSVCGTSALGPPRGSAASVVYLASACTADLGRGGKAAATAVHELLHNLGARPLTHPCAGSPTHACDSSRDILYPKADEETTLERLQLDVGHDDYYGLRAIAAAAPDVRTSPFLEHLDARPPASLAVRDFFATSEGTSVTLHWAPAAASPGLLYRVSRDGRLLAETAALQAGDRAAVGTTIVYSIRATDPAGSLGPPLTIRFLVGSGLVDESGHLIRDTVPPSRVTRLSATCKGRTLVLRWTAVDDPGDLAGYRIFRDRRPLGALRRETSATIALGCTKAVWTVAAVDRSGNTGAQSDAVRTTARR